MSLISILSKLILFFFRIIMSFFQNFAIFSLFKDNIFCNNFVLWRSLQTCIYWQNFYVSIVQITFLCASFLCTTFDFIINQFDQSTLWGLCSSSVCSSFWYLSISYRFSFEYVSYISRLKDLDHEWFDQRREMYCERWDVGHWEECQTRNVDYVC